MILHFALKFDWQGAHYLVTVGVIPCLTRGVSLERSSSIDLLVTLGESRESGGSRWS